MKKYLSATATTTALFTVLSLLFAPIALAQNPPWIGQSYNTNPAPASICNLEDVFTLAVQAVVGLIGLAAFVMLIVGGFKMITAGGDAKASESARNTITFAVIGVTIAVLAIFILRFINVITGVDILNFSVCR